MSLDRFAQLVARVMDGLPEKWQGYLENVVVDVEDEPTVELLRDMDFTEEEIAAGESMYGLFVPLDLPHTEGMDFDEPPHRIIIYRKPLLEDFTDRRSLMVEIRKTVVHELAHHFGYTDRDLEEFDATPDPFADGTDPDSAS